MVYLNNWNKILETPGNIESTKKADHILEMPDLGEFMTIVLTKVGQWKAVTNHIKDDLNAT